MSFQFATPWMLSVLILVPWLARRARPATMKHATTSLTRGLPRSWRIVWRPILTVLRLLTIALAVIALARPQIVSARETITGEGVDTHVRLLAVEETEGADIEP